MREFNLSHVVSAFSSYVSTLNSLWGLFIVATFSAAGFGASMKDQFTPTIAVILIIAYAAFAAAHLRVLMVTSAKLKVMGEEIGERLQRDGQGFTDYPRSLAAILHTSFNRRAIVVIHLTIDLCVVAIIAAAASLFPI